MAIKPARDHDNAFERQLHHRQLVCLPLKSVLSEPQSVITLGAFIFSILSFLSHEILSRVFSKLLCVMAPNRLEVFLSTISVLH